MRFSTNSFDFSLARTGILSQSDCHPAVALKRKSVRAVEARTLGEGRSALEPRDFLPSWDQPSAAERKSPVLLVDHVEVR